MISEGSKDRQPSRLLSVPHVLVHCVGLAVASTLVLASLKLDLYKDLSWWMVLLPPAIALCLTFLVFTVAVFTWVYVAYIFFTQGIEVDVESDFRLDVLFRAAKICFLGHGYVSLLMISFGLLLWKLHTWPALPLAYPLSPLIVLGMVYMIFAIVFTQPEVDPPSYFLVGISLVSQSIMLVIKLDYAYDLPWAATFAPSWLTYVLLLIYCVLSPLQALREAQGEGESSSAGSSHDSPYGGAEGRSSRSSAVALHAQLRKVAGIVSWVLGFGLSQVLLTLRLDVLYKVAWFSVILPAFLGWILLLLCVTTHVSEYFTGIGRLLLETFGLVLGIRFEGVVEEQGIPLLPDKSPRPSSSSLPWK